MWPHPSTRTPTPGFMKFTIKIGPVVLEKKMLTHDARQTTNDAQRRTTTDANP